ncbi:MAG: hypothetical protein ABSD10_01420 [Candidatus Saccharimonadales bacterium]|jgi:hypothetical protein
MSDTLQTERLSSSLWRTWAPPDVELSDSYLVIHFDASGDPQPVLHTGGLRTDKISLTDVGKAVLDAVHNIRGIPMVGISCRFVDLCFTESCLRGRPAPLDTAEQALASIL